MTLHLPRMTWPAIVTAVGALLTLRIVYLIWLCPYELVGDEAQYWVWSKHLDWSYYSKGPGVAWTIAASTAVFGNSEWAIRLPSVMAGAVTSLALARLAFESSDGNARVAACTAAMFYLVPGFFGMTQLMTIDAPFVACWSVAAWVAWRLHGRLQRGESAPGWWLALATAVGLGFLYKYTMLLLLPGLLWFGWQQRRHWQWNPRTTAAALIATAWWLMLMSPVAIWNQQHDWPTVAHLLGHLGMRAGDIPRPSHESWSYTPYWTLEMIGAQLGIIGPMLILMFMAARSESPARRFMLNCALPVLVFYAGVSFVAKVEGNWMLAGYTTLLIPAAWVATHSASPLVKWLWRAAFVYGLVTLVGISFPSLAARTPAVGHFVPLYRISGARDLANCVSVAARDIEIRTGRTPVLIADRYDRASLLSYYLPSHPVVYSAQSRLGGRRSSHDLFADTNIADPKLLGLPAVFVGADAERWRNAFPSSPIDSADAEHRIFGTESLGRIPDR